MLHCLAFKLPTFKRVIPFVNYFNSLFQGVTAFFVSLFSVGPPQRTFIEAFLSPLAWVPPDIFPRGPCLPAHTWGSWVKCGHVLISYKKTFKIIIMCLYIFSSMRQRNVSMYLRNKFTSLCFVKLFLISNSICFK